MSVYRCQISGHREYVLKSEIKFIRDVSRAHFFVEKYFLIAISPGVFRVRQKSVSRNIYCSRSVQKNSFLRSEKLPHKRQST